MKHLIGNSVFALLLLLGSATTWAGRGDIDPHYGTGGRLEAASVAVSLPDDRLVVASVDDDGLHIRRFDANGHVDPTFGDHGEVVIRYGGHVGYDFHLGYAAAAPDGALLFEGLLERDTDSCPHFAVDFVWSVDRDGHVVGRYGRYRSWYSDEVICGMGSSALRALTFDSVGRILQAEGGCPLSITRLMPSGEADASFGTDGAIHLNSCSDIALFGARDDGSVVIGDRDAIFGLDASGAPDQTFGAGGRVSLGLPAETLRGRLLPDGGVLIVGSGSSSTLANIVLTKFDRKGQIDPAFGGGTGSAQLDLGEAFFGVAGSRQSVSDFVLVPDARHLYLRASILNADSTPLCAGGIARLSIDGMPDVSFGKRGLTCLDYGTLPFTLVASQRTGAPLFGLADGNLYRLLVDATASPGIVVPKSPWPSEVRESDATVTIPVVRIAGHNGAVSASVVAAAANSCDGGACASDGAVLGSDFQVASQRLDWADGEEEERTIAVTIVNDAEHELDERFNIGISGALALDTSSVDITILDDDPVTATGGSGDSGDSGGGGGSLSWVTLLALLGLLRVRRRFPAQRV